jgi:YD repeat-containing protein
VIQADGQVWRQEYDLRGNLTAEVDPTGARVSYRHGESGALSAITDAAGRLMLLETNVAGMIIATTDAAGDTTR